MDLIRLNKMHESEEMTDDDRMVKEQKTKAYKWFCGVVYGHLFIDRRNFCQRCGYKKGDDGQTA